MSTTDREVWYQVPHYVDAIREVSGQAVAKDAERRVRWGDDGFADFFRTRNEAVTCIVERSLLEVAGAEVVLLKARARLTKLRKKYPDAPEWTLSGGRPTPEEPR